MKSVLIVLLEFLEHKGIQVTSINLSIDANGQIAYCTGTFANNGTSSKFSRRLTEHAYRFVAAQDFRFVGTCMEVTEDFKFIVTRP
jgi:hypothetical protein